MLLPGGRTTTACLFLMAITGIVMRCGPVENDGWEPQRPGAIGSVVRKLLGG